MSAGVHVLVQPPCGDWAVPSISLRAWTRAGAQGVTSSDLMGSAAPLTVVEPCRCTHLPTAQGQWPPWDLRLAVVQLQLVIPEGWTEAEDSGDPASGEVRFGGLNTAVRGQV